ncbi:hypothetical protein OG604_30890 [Streptomyces sp. NBC_01231]|nr:hypothetical protein OG604_30890 [Streptomyces sp. NBC_01231]
MSERDRSTVSHRRRARLAACCATPSACGNLSLPAPDTEEPGGGAADDGAAGGGTILGLERATALVVLALAAVVIGGGGALTVRTMRGTPLMGRRGPRA